MQYGPLPGPSTQTPDNVGKPLEGGYWLGPSINCLAATSRSEIGPSWSGKPCPKLMASCFNASTVMCWKMLVGRLEKTGLGMTGMFRGAEPSGRAFLSGLPQAG